MNFPFLLFPAYSAHRVQGKLVSSNKISLLTKAPFCSKGTMTMSTEPWDPLVLSYATPSTNSSIGWHEFLQVCTKAPACSYYSKREEYNSSVCDTHLDLWPLGGVHRSQNQEMGIGRNLLSITLSNPVGKFSFSLWSFWFCGSMGSYSWAEQGLGSTRFQVGITLNLKLVRLWLVTLDSSCSKRAGIESMSLLVSLTDNVIVRKQSCCHVKGQGGTCFAFRWLIGVPHLRQF